MKYMLMLWGAEAAADIPPDQIQERMQRWDVYTQELIAAGAFVSGEGLQEGSTSTTLRLNGNGGDRVLSDGPFAETKEQIAGFYVLDCANLDAALEWASKVPSALDGYPVEVRPCLRQD